MSPYEEALLIVSYWERQVWERKPVMQENESFICIQTITRNSQEIQETTIIVDDIDLLLDISGLPKTKFQEKMKIDGIIKVIKVANKGGFFHIYTIKSY